MRVTDSHLVLRGDSMFQIVYSSPTGNTKLLAEELGKILQSSVQSIDNHELNKNDHIVFMYSIHAFNPTRTFNRFIKNLEDGTNKVSLIATCAADSKVNHSVSRKLKKRLTKKGYQIILDQLVAMPVTIVLKMKPEKHTEIVQNGISRITELATDLLEEVPNQLKQSFTSRMFHLIGKAEDPAARLFGLELHAKKSCTKCGICVSSCPEKNIRFNKKNNIKFGFSCMMCMKCIYICPEKAITPYISKFIPIKGGYNVKENITE